MVPASLTAIDLVALDRFLRAQGLGGIAHDGVEKTMQKANFCVWH
jgi:hypothetical protein